MVGKDDFVDPSFLTSSLKLFDFETVKAIFTTGRTKEWGIEIRKGEISKALSSNLRCRTNFPNNDIFLVERAQ